MTPLYSYLVGIASLTLSLIFSLAAFIYHQRRGIIFDRYFQRLPMAVRYEDLESRVEDLQQERDRILSDLNTAKAIISESELARSERDELQAELNRMRAERDELETISKRYQAIQEQLSDALEKLASTQAEAHRLSASAEGERERISQLQRQSEQLANSIRDLEERNRALRARMEATQAEIDSLERERQRLRSDAEALEEKKTRLEEESDRAKERLDETLREVEDARKALASTRADVESVEGRLHTAKSKLASVAGPERSQEMAVEELWTPAIIPTAFEDGLGPESEAEALQNVRSHLRAHGLAFSDRTINAFHTSLKIGMETPLLVLAGISGTGKSLLPRRYAEAMGIHFLPIAVQPRWDGPQDLLGFFNHLEGTYKATELVRALIQLDPIERDWHSERIVSAHERVLLVLLDEMNLARVEYYFSDFLSRLEARREITDINSNEDRRPAEIPLDLGGLLDSGDDAGRILPWNNVLFTGSMNEDESTLALSDKVVDRANIMRFGRPSQLSTVQPTIAPNQYAARHFLHVDTWQQWIDDGNARDISGSVTAKIEEANLLLDRVGRPFGYRVSRAISAYVKQHPLDDWRVALADQLEQRIMPKLRGLDLHEPETQPVLTAFEAMARDLDDEALALAIRRGCDPGSSLFAWRGVERSHEDR